MHIAMQAVTAADFHPPVPPTSSTFRLGADDYRKRGMYFPPRGITTEQLEQYRAGFEAAEMQDAREEIEWLRMGC